MADQTPRAELIARLSAFVAPGATLAHVDATFVGQCVDEARALVGQLVGKHEPPTEILDRATIEAASELYHRRQAPNGISQFATPDGSPIRIARDPMNTARAILTPFLPLGFA